MLSGSHLYAVDAESLLTAPRVLFQIQHADIVRGVAWDADSRLFATGGDDKKLRIFKGSDLVWEEDTLKKVTQLALAPGALESPEANPVRSLLNRLLVADKFGSVYRGIAFEAGADAKAAVPWLKASVMGRTLHEDTPILLGHYSTITQLHPVSFGNQNFIVTAEKDEKIRVSSFPATYDIVSYCLGHTKFVSALDHFLLNGSPALISGGGDGTLVTWDLLSGRRLAQLNIAETLNGQRRSELSVLSAISSTPCIRHIVVWSQQQIAVVAVEEYEFLMTIRISPNKLEIVEFIPLSASPLDFAIRSAAESNCDLYVVSGFGAKEATGFHLLSLNQTHHGVVRDLQSPLPKDQVGRDMVTQRMERLSPTLSLRKIVSSRWGTGDSVVETDPSAKRARIQ